MIAKIKQFVKEFQQDIILFIGVVLIFLLSFAGGYITAKVHPKPPITIEEPSLGTTITPYNATMSSQGPN